jgi:nitrogen fixation/metabolism regulation signal transduction histidine kinase
MNTTNMLLNRFFFNVLIRVTLIVISGIVLGIVLQHLGKGYYYTLAGIIAIILFQTYGLINKVNKTNADLEKFFSSVEDHDSSVRFPDESKHNSFSKLHNRMNSLNTIIHHARIENERTSHFLQHVVNHVDIGLLAFDVNGKVEIYNKAARKYLNIAQPGGLLSSSTNEEIFGIVHTIKAGQEILYKTKTDNFVRNILVKAAEMKIENNLIKLVSFQDITHELDRKELESWQRLIRVLTHEIMNSISPITSLSSVISGYFKDGGREISPENVTRQIISKTLSGLDTIEETGKGLLDFVDKYRSLTSLPKPNLCRFSVDSLFGKCKLLMESAIPANMKITTTVHPKDLSLEADYAQVEQILINLIKNAAEALYERQNGIIRLKASYDEGATFIEVQDNGVGISKDAIDDIFVPFYTTKENGSGIGLSLSKQIMQNHNGTISVNSAPGKGATFTLKFAGTFMG